jgi:hypothetical protein
MFVRVTCMLATHTMDLIKTERRSIVRVELLKPRGLQSMKIQGCGFDLQVLRF